MPALNQYLLAGFLVWLVVTIIWLVSLKIADASIMDPVWGFGFVLLAWFYFALSAPGDARWRSLVLCCLVTIWGIRLTLHLFSRNRGAGEDFRYQNWREQHGQTWWWRSYFQVFLLQGFLMWLISLPLLTAQLPGNPVDLQFIDIAGIGFWLVGFSFEVLGDWQLSRFRSNPDNRGKVLRSGLWRYSRHPNYFGDAVLWWGYGFLGASFSLGLWPLLSPVLMTYLLLRVSGVVLLEKSLAGQKDGYREYQQTTSAFFPWFPKKAP